jgi:hypothetical protein
MDHSTGILLPLSAFYIISAEKLFDSCRDAHFLLTIQNADSSWITLEVCMLSSHSKLNKVTQMVELQSDAMIASVAPMKFNSRVSKTVNCHHSRQLLIEPTHVSYTKGASRYWLNETIHGFHAVFFNC